MADQIPLEVENETLILTRQRIMARFACTEEEAAERLRRSIQNLFNDLDTPNPPPAPLPEPPLEPPVPLPDPPNPPAIPMDEDTEAPPKKKATYVDFDLDAPIASRIPHNPSEYAVGKVENLKYVELWYFTTEGCQEAGKATPLVADKTFGLLKMNSGIALQPLKATKASKNAMVDEYLSWEQIMTARHTMINTASHIGWNKKLTLALTQFYINLEGCQSPYFILALFTLLMSLLVKYLHSHPLYTFTTSLSSSA